MRSSFPPVEVAPDIGLSNYLYNGVAVARATAAAVPASVVLARALGPGQCGVYSQVAWLIGIAVGLFGGRLTYTAMRYLGAYSISDDSAVKARIAVSLAKAQLLAVPGCLVFLLFAPQTSSLVSWHLDLRLIRLSGLGILALSLFQLGMAILRGLQEYRSLAALPVLDSTTTLGIIVIVARYPPVAVSTTSSVLRQLLVLVRPGTVGLRRNPGSAHTTTVWHPMLRHSLLVFLATVADQLVLRWSQGARQPDLPGRVGQTQLWRENDTHCRMPSE